MMKIVQNYPKTARIQAAVVFTLKVVLVKIAQIAAKYLVHNCRKICCKDIYKIAQSGHTVMKVSNYNFKKFSNLNLSQKFFCSSGGR